jgi:lactoylglutathione lyase
MNLREQQRMKLRYTIIYVADVPSTVGFYARAFGLTTKFVHEENLYAEMETGETVLAFASEEMAMRNGVDIQPNRLVGLAAGFEIAFVTSDPTLAFTKAIAAGATQVTELSKKPWGQIVGYVRDLNGCLVEIGSPISA